MCFQRRQFVGVLKFSRQTQFGHERLQFRGMPRRYVSAGLRRKRLR
jgi:hypothetical protein